MYKTFKENKEKHEDIYFHSRDISQYFKLTEDEIQQHIFSTHIGLLISCGKSYFIYQAVTGLYEPGRVQT